MHPPAPTHIRSREYPPAPTHVRSREYPPAPARVRSRQQLWRHYTAGLCLTLLGGAAAAQGLPPGFPCQPVTCSTLLPATVADPHTNDCAYRAGNLWWVDYVAGSLAWSERVRAHPVTVAIFDDGAWIDHEDLRNQLWTNEAEAHGFREKAHKH